MTDTKATATLPKNIQWNDQELQVIEQITDAGRPSRKGFKCKDESGVIRYVWS